MTKSTFSPPFTIRPYRAPISEDVSSSDLKGVMASWEDASAIAHPFLSEEFQKQVREAIPTLYLPNADTWVLEIEQEVVGFISLLGNEIGALFLAQRFHGLGLGKQLVDKALELHETLEVEVFEKNSIGRRFYQRLGFTLIEEKDHPETGEQLLRMRYSLVISA